MNADQAKRLNLKDLLARLGFAPDHEAKGEFWYRSPFREEKEPSFHLKEDSGKWFWNDFGAGEGGNVIAFALKYLCWPFTPSGVIRWQPEGERATNRGGETQRSARAIPWGRRMRTTG